MIIDTVDRAGEVRRAAALGEVNCGMHGDVIEDEIIIRNAVSLESDLGLVVEGQRHGYRFETEIESLRLW